MFCADCRRIVQHLQGSYTRADGSVTALHHATAVTLKAAAEDGCRFCAVFWDSFNLSQKEQILLSDESHVENEVPSGKLIAGSVDDEEMARFAGSLRNFVTLGQISTNKETLPTDNIFTILLNPERNIRPEGMMPGISIFILQPEQVTSTKLSSGSPMEQSSNTGAQQPWSIAKKWLNECLTTHKTCSYNRREAWYPTRLLDLQYANDAVRLVETATEVCNGSYMTLSHRWGPTSRATLRRSTYAQLCRGIPSSTLPQAFLDAISICQRLDVRYLWIDGLCIKQDPDDLSDWLNESALMHKIYSNSFLNISAIAASESAYSFFVERDPEFVRESWIDTALDGTKLGTKIRRNQVLDMMFWERQINHAHLNLRGWVLQERLLAPRVLHFGRNQLLWECHECDAAESFPDGLPSFMSTHKNTRFKNLDPQFYEQRMSRVHGQDPPEMGPYRLWQRIVDAYTTCKLTNGKDKLIALSGIAKRIGSMMTLPDEYVVGMWRRYIASELLWQVSSSDKIEDESPRRAAEYRAPSFTWASVDGVIQAGSPSETGLLIEVLEVNLTFVTNDRTGLVQGGDLILRGQLQKLSIHIRTRLDGDKQVRMESLDRRWYVMFVNDQEARASTGEEWERNGPEIALDEHEQYFDPLDRTDLFCIPARSWADGRFLYVLLLQLIDVDAGTYRRVGLATAIEQHEVDVFRAQAARSANFPALASANGLHTIRII